jgi:hypothetical protein
MRGVRSVSVDHIEWLPLPRSRRRYAARRPSRAAEGTDGKTNSPLRFGVRLTSRTMAHNRAMLRPASWDDTG